MTIGIAVTTACILLMLPVARKDYWKWATIILIMLSSLFFFYNPSYTDDLYRYYNVLDAVRNEQSVSSSLLETYKLENPVFIPYLWIISLFQNNSFLPVITGIICFLMFLWLLKRVFVENEGEHWQIVICLWLLLFLTRFMDITGIRNILSSTIISIALYLDLVENKKKSIVLYVLGALIHSMGFIYIILRLILLLYNRFNRIIIPIVLISASAIITYFSNDISLLLSRSVMGSSTYDRLLIYMNNQANMGINERYRFLYAVIYIFILVICLLYSAHFDDDNRFKKLSDYTVLLVFFTFSFFGQRELFNRERLLLVPLGVILVGEMLKRISGDSVLSIIVERSNGGLLNKYSFSAAAVYGFIIFSIIYFILVVNYDYSYFNSGFVF